ncbi:Protein arginine N-methyltransferase 2 [Sparassis crispa]|uniref:Protein arginine N-methyltransferase 2 n=1 Tax=Sparassis crispa TaxID=139825 RepID=A0A401GFW4_9APHY|nr:Protein arginine N-methyltransferase 2 [Sparassis crispa]GBE80993.1 Protein arginine N-methyltransferase 2 [Sparassis crispa]
MRSRKSCRLNKLISVATSTIQSVNATRLHQDRQVSSRLSANMASTVAEDSDTDMEVEELIDLGNSLINAILERSSLSKIKRIIDAGAPLWFQDDEGMSALHAAAYVENEDLVRFLIGEGALWNAVDNLHNTAGDIALSLNNGPCYTIIRDAGIRSELLLSLLSSRSPSTDSSLSHVLKATDATPAGSTDAFLSSRLQFTKDTHGQDICLLKVNEQEEIGVMMGWERGIMQETVHKLCSDHENLPRGLKVLNVGFGLGIIDCLFQALPVPPSIHVIIEPHPDVLQHMRELGWYNKPGVTILEDYKELHRFFGHVPDLLAGPESRFGFFNGLGATNALFYDVYTHVSDLHLADIGIDVACSDVDVFQGHESRWGKSREYFAMRSYRLPVGKMRTM